MVSGGGNRRAWTDLPDALRARVGEVLGSPVVAASTQPGGFSPGSADRVVTADGRRAFVKAVSASVNPHSQGVHRREAEVLALMPDGLPIARLLGAAEDGEWFALVLEDVPGQHPALPWRPDELEAALDAYAGLADRPVEGPMEGLLDPLGDDLPSGWSQVSPGDRLALPDDLLAWCSERLETLQRLEAEAVGLVAGDRLVHLDARADNLLLRADGSVAVVDWPWAVRGAAWFDPLVLLINVRLFDPAFDVDAVMVRHPAFAGMPAEAVPAVLAALSGFFVVMGSQPPPPGLPTLRAFQLEQAEVTLAWLQECWPG
ncbi:MAG: phosphotransferase [Actinobacteria bacterium]|nr:phosphotransferase [Actinomycetota bacterium]